MAQPGVSDAVEYFRRRPFGRVLEALRQRYEALGRVGGRVRLAVSEEERLALRDFMGALPGRGRQGAGAKAGASAQRADVSGPAGGSVLTLDVARFDAALRASRFGCTLPELLEAYFGSPVVTRPAWRQARALEWERLLEAIEQEAKALGEPLAMRWWAAVREGQATRSRAWIRRAFEGGADALGTGSGESDHTADGVAEEAGALASHGQMGVGGPLLQIIRAVLKALASLPGPRGRQETLPVFAATLTGDPHAFDPDRAAGRLLERVLVDLLPEVAFDAAGVESPAMRREVVLAAVGLARDDLSSTVLVAHLRAAILADGRPDPLVAGAREAGVPVAYPLRVVRRWTAVAATTPVFIVENPSVFGSLAQSFPAPDAPTLICTAGQPSLAAYALLDRLGEAGVEMLYGGDFDLPGILIARALKMRYGQRLRLWRMDAGNYEQALVRATGAVPLTPRERRQLTALVSEPGGASPELGLLAETMLRRGRKAFQENLLPELETDVASHVRGARDRALPAG